MIRIESVHIKEVRGIRDLKLTMSQGTFVVCGPNGSGKSGAEGVEVGGERFGDGGAREKGLEVPGQGQTAGNERLDNRLEFCRVRRGSQNPSVVASVSGETSQGVECCGGVGSISPRCPL